MSAEAMNGQAEKPTSSNPVSFLRPPVIETVLGVHFTPLSKFRNAHLGAFWKALGPEWPSVVDATPLSPQVERFGGNQDWNSMGFQIKLSQDLSTRLMIRHKNNDRMLQIQNSRFHYNWLGASGGVYPRYETVRPEFDAHLLNFQRFLEDEKLGAIAPTQWEVTYVNQIPKGDLWSTPDQWASIVKLLPSAAPTNLLFEGVGGEWHYEIPPARGRLHVQMRSAKDSDGKDQLVLTFTARGPIIKGGTNLAEGLDLARSTIVSSFKGLTTERAHKYWGLEP